MIYSSILEAKRKGKKKFAVLIDPDKVGETQLDQTIQLAEEAGVDYFFVGSSLLINNSLDRYLLTIRRQCRIPTLLFPGSTFQLSHHADGILLLSLISGRNPELLIGQHVIAAPFLAESRLEILSTGYMLIDGGVPTSVSYISNTNPIPANKKDIALCTAMAGEMLGLRLIYLDAGSGARHPVSPDMVASVSQNIRVPLIVGGGIHKPEQALAATKAGADLIVVGNAVEKEPALLIDMAAAVHSLNTVDSGRPTANGGRRTGNGER